MDPVDDVVLAIQEAYNVSMLSYCYIYMPTNFLTMHL